MIILDFMKTYGRSDRWTIEVKMRAMNFRENIISLIILSYEDAEAGIIINYIKGTNPKQEGGGWGAHLVFIYLS